MMTEIETRPSAAHRWTKCSAAPLFASRAGPQPTSDPAREGTCAAWVAELMLDKIRLKSPVFHGDTLYAYTEVLGKSASATHANAGVVHFRHWGVNQKDETVFEGERRVLIKRRIN